MSKMKIPYVLEKIEEREENSKKAKDEFYSWNIN
jgi:hypothetical protein